jgi:hypothetical protein
MAPPAGQGAALHENRRTDSRTVVDGETFDIKYDTGSHTEIPLFHLL